MKPLYVVLPISYLQLLVQTHALFTGKLANVSMEFLPCGIEVSLSFLPLRGGRAGDQPSLSSTTAIN
jgi:hypothetical protein